MINLDEVLTFSEAAEKWGLADGKTIRKAVERNRFKDYEIKKSGNVWLTTYEAMVRVFGQPREESTLFSFYDFFDYRYPYINQAFENFNTRAQETLARGEMVTIVESNKHPDRIVCILKNKEELDGWNHRLKNYLNNMSNQRNNED